MDGFGKMFGIMGRPAKKNAFSREIDRSELDMGFLEKTFRAQGDFELTGDLCNIGRRDNSGGQDKIIRIQLQASVKNGVRNRHS